MYRKYSLIIIGAFCVLAVIVLALVSATDIFKDQDYIDSINVSNLTWRDFKCNLTGDPPYYYKEGYHIKTYYTCLDIEKYNETHYHIFDADFEAGKTLLWN